MIFALIFVFVISVIAFIVFLPEGLASAGIKLRPWVEEV